MSIICNPGRNFVARVGVKSFVHEEQTTLTLHHNPYKFLDGDSWISDAVKPAQDLFNTKSRGRALFHPCGLHSADYRSEIDVVSTTYKFDICGSERPDARLPFRMGIPKLQKENSKWGNQV